MNKNLLRYCTIGLAAASLAACSDDEEVIEITTDPVEDSVEHFSEPANTYIVTEAGKYSFDTRKPLGDAITGIESADWIWATKINETDTEQQIISDVKYEDGKIYFNATGNRGNAVIAAFNASRTSVWVWLIWCTEQPECMEFENGAEFLDRAIGATSATPGDRNCTGVILYQHGRNVPIFGGYDDELRNGQTMTFAEAEKWTIMNPDYDYKWEVSASTATIAESLAAPTTFFANGNGLHWQPTFDHTVWGETKTNYDPSPAGYKLPAYTDWGTIITDRKVIYDETLKGGTYTYNGKTAWFPANNNGRHYQDASYIEGVDSSLTYWNGSVYVDEEPWFNRTTYYPSRAMIKYSEGVVGNSNHAMAAATFAFAVRCVRITD